MHERIFILQFEIKKIRYGINQISPTLHEDKLLITFILK
jgi:hypothetical protein